MASSAEFAEYVCGQVRGAGCISYRKMFGEYGIYCDGKIIGLICDDCFYLKPTESGMKILGDYVKAPPYEGAKPYLLIEDMEDRELMIRLVRATYDTLPEPQPKKPRKKKHDD